MIDRHFGGIKSDCARAIGMHPASFTRAMRARVPTMSMLTLLKLAQWTDLPFLEFLRLAGKTAEAEFLALRLAIPVEAQIKPEDAHVLTAYHRLTPDLQGLVRQLMDALQPGNDGAPVVWIDHKRLRGLGHDKH